MRGKETFCKSKKFPQITTKIVVRIVHIKGCGKLETVFSGPVAKIIFKRNLPLRLTAFRASQ